MEKLIQQAEALCKENNVTEMVWDLGTGRIGPVDLYFSLETKVFVYRSKGEALPQELVSQMVVHRTLNPKPESTSE